MFDRQNRRRRNALLGSAAAAVLLAGCMANPGDAPTVGDDEPARDDVTRPDEQLKQINIGVDAFGEGFNPHLIADASPVTDLVASLTFPSAFKPDPEDPTRWRMNRDLLESAEIVPVDAPVPEEDRGAEHEGQRDDAGAGADASGSAAPSIAAEAAEADARDARPGDTRIRYRIRPGAQWSDGTPISGSDFRYLHATLLANAGVADSAGYERIKAITVSAGGREVDVLVDGPMPEWRSLFRNLLPSHLLRPSATPFTEILDTAMPASGGRFTAQSIDVGRGEIRLVRNDRFWGEIPAATDTVIIRSVDGAVAGAEQLRAAQLQALRVRPSQTTSLTYSLVPGTVEVPQVLPRQLTLHANVASPVLADAKVRRAVLGSVDVRAVAAIATGRTDDIEIPARPESLGELPETPAAPASLASLAPEVTEKNPLIIGVMGGDEQAVAAARAVADQLTGAGVPTRVTNATGEELAGSLLPYGRVDMVMAWDRAADSPLRAASRWSCPSGTRASTRPQPERSGGRDEERESTASSSSEPTSGPSASTAATGPSAAPDASPTGEPAGKTGAAPETVARGANLSGLCDPELDALIDQALSGRRSGLDTDVRAPAGSVPESILARVDAEAVELGIVVDRLVTVMGGGVELPPAGAARARPAEWPDGPFIGPLMTLADWRRVPSATTSQVTGTTTDPAEDESGGAGSGAGAGAGADPGAGERTDRGDGNGGGPADEPAAGGPN